MQDTPTARTSPAPDLRRAISRQAWLANRAGNALRRPAFIVAISVGTFVAALTSMIAVPQAKERPQLPPQLTERPETLSVAGTLAMARVNLVRAESTLVAARLEAAAADSAAAATPVDTLSLEQLARRDTLTSRLDRLDGQLARSRQAPLLSSYRSLADLPELRSDQRVRALLDTLADIERERETFGAAGGVDPVFVALTSRASEVGRSIQEVAVERRAELAAQLGPDTLAVAVVEAPVIDSTAPMAARDSIHTAIQSLEVELARRRAQSVAMDIAERRALADANAVAPLFAVLAAAFVLSGVVGFAFALVGELKKPRISHAAELERFLGVRVLSRVEPAMPSIDRGRRQADRSAPPYFDPGAEGYQLAYLGLSTDHPSLLMAIVTGDDPVVSALVACNLAAVAASEARNTLLIDLEPSGRVAAVLRSRARPGVVDILASNASWPDATTPASIGRDRVVDLVPYGSSASKPPATELIELARREATRLARYYDAIVLVAAPQVVVEGLPAALPSPEVIYCAQPRITPLRPLRAQLEEIRSAGGFIRGIVLWDAERPDIPAQPEPRSPRATPSNRDGVVAAR